MSHDYGTDMIFDASQVVELLTGILRNNSTNGTDTKVSTYAYKLDECTNWDSWFAPIDEMLGVVSNLTGPTAPHYYMFVRRDDVDAQIPTHTNAQEIEVQDFPPTFPRNPDDVMVIVKNRLSDDQVTQVMAVIPACMDARTKDVPTELHSRNPIDPEMKSKIEKIAPELRARNLISADASSYLLRWVQGTLPIHKRPDYRWLQHRWKRVQGRPEVPLSDKSNVDVIRQMKRIRCDWKVKGSCLNCCHDAIIHNECVLHLSCMCLIF